MKNNNLGFKKISKRIFQYLNDGNCLKLITYIAYNGQSDYRNSMEYPSKWLMNDLNMSSSAFYKARKKLIDDDSIKFENKQYSIVL